MVNRILGFLIFNITLIDNIVSNNCRFALNYSVSDILDNNNVLTQFIEEFLYWERQFATVESGALHSHLYTTNDGINLNYINGTFKALRPFSSSSQESVHLMYLIHEMNDKQFKNIPYEINIINTKLKAYDKFNQMYPGFGGMIPWFQIAQSTTNKSDYYITPTPDWQNQTAALDQGQIYWALYGLKWALLQNYNAIINDINNKNININYTFNMIEEKLNLMEIYAKRIFYDNHGKIRWVSTIGNTLLYPNDTKQTYSGNAWVGDPYEGELFEWLLDLKSVWKNNENEQIWNATINNYHAINYTFYDSNNILSDITVQEGWHFSAHEQWKIFELPYLDSAIIKTVFENCEIVRTLNSDFGNNGKYNAIIPGMYSDINGPIANWSQPSYYISGAGIPSVACCPPSNGFYFDTITPYSTMNIFFFNQTIGSVWLLNMLKGPSMQNIYGSTEAIFINGTEVCPICTWVAKITTYIAIKGGISQWTKYGLLEEGLYDRFINQMTKLYTDVFGDISSLKTNHTYGLPNLSIPTNYLSDFTTCK